jgi:hypothetical protein
MAGLRALGIDRLRTAESEAPAHAGLRELVGAVCALRFSCPSGAEVVSLLDMVGKVDPVVISVISAVAVSGVGATLSYLFARRTLRLQLAGTGELDRQKALREYELQAMKTFRETVGGPKSHIVETVQDLVLALSRLLPLIFDGRRWDLGANTEGYRRYLVWRIVRPYVWIEILNRSMLHLDRTLGDWVKDELRFLGYCRLLERAATQKEIFSEADYHLPEWGHIWGGELDELIEQLIVNEGNTNTCVTQTKFMKDKVGNDKVLAIANMFLKPVGEEDGLLRDLRRARLVTIYGASNLFLEEFRLPYFRLEPWRSSVEHLDRLIIDEQRRLSLKNQLLDFLATEKQMLDA